MPEASLRAAASMLRWALAWCALGVCVAGCSREHYRRRADRETYGVMNEKITNPAWALPPRRLEAPPQSRLFDPANPDRPMMPPDDPAAHQYMHLADGHRGYLHWHRDGDAPTIESPQWISHVDRESDGSVKLSSQMAVELGVLNSREYQFEFENLYLAALTLTLERYQFDSQWFGGNTTDFRHFGTGGLPNESNALTTFSQLGFSRTFTTGGQLLADFANTFTWEFTGANSRSTISMVNLSMIQPLMRGAFREVQMEPLTQAERNVLYAARQFARFRKVFYFNLVSADDGYLQLLLRVQAIRNQEANLESLRQDLLAHEALAKAGIVSQIQVDQVYQSYQSGQLDLIQLRNGLQTSLDIYKIRLGLPPELPVKLDESLLQPFELTDADLARFEGLVEDALARFRQLDEPPARPQLEEGFATLQQANERLFAIANRVRDELQRWEQKDEQATGGDDERQRMREQAARQQLRERLDETNRDLDETGLGIRQAISTFDEHTPAENWEAIQRWARRSLNVVQNLSVIQTQIRAQLIQLPDVSYEQDVAIVQAFDNRLDLMNARAQVVDAWRKIKVAADALESDVDLFANANIVTEPGTSNPFDFSAQASSYQAGIHFDGPLNRLAERNLYRAQLIEYQRARRRFMASRDAISQAVRFDLRTLNAERLNFEITRQRLLVAARQVEEARLQLLAPGDIGDSSTTQNVLLALNSLLDAKNALIGTWARYHSARLQLWLDLELLQLDPRGLVLDDDRNTDAEEIDRPVPVAIVNGSS